MTAKLLGSAKALVPLALVGGYIITASLSANASVEPEVVSLLVGASAGTWLIPNKD